MRSRCLPVLLSVTLVFAACGGGTRSRTTHVALDTTAWAGELDSLERLGRQRAFDRQLELAATVRKATHGIEAWARQEATVLSTMAGTLARQGGDPDTTWALYKEALHVAEAAGDSGTVAKVLTSMGRMKGNLGDYGTAMDIAMRALRIQETRNDRVGTARAMGVLGALYWKQKDLPAAIAMMRCSIALQQGVDSVGLMLGQNDLAVMLLDAGRPDSALQLLHQSLLVQQRIDSARSRVMQLNNMGFALADMGLGDSALVLFRSSMEQARRRNEVRGFGPDLRGIGTVLLQQERFAEAGPPLDSALVWAQRLDLLDEQKNLHGYLSQQREGVGDLPGALAHAHAEQELADSVMTAEKEATMNELRVRYETDKKERENQQLRIAQELSHLRVERGRWAAIAAIVLAVVIGIIARMLLLRAREQARRREEDLEQQAMRLQMDPHFLFNALNTIPGLYASGDAAHANDHVGHLSKFLRLVLETSRKRTIALSQELELVDDYLHICANRRPGSFTWSTRVSPDVHAERVAIPPMLVQPLVENALEHGLSGVDHDGRVEVSVAREGGDVVIAVRDNGSGRVAAQRPMERTGGSFGLDLVRDRIRILDRRTREADPVTVRDAHHPDGSPAGTVVTIRLRSGAAPVRPVMAVLLITALLLGCGGGGAGQRGHQQVHQDTTAWKQELDSLRIYGRQNELDRQLALAERIQAHTRGVDSLGRQQARSLAAIASVYSQQPQGGDTALVLMREALRIAEAASDSSTMGRTLLGIGAISEGLGDHVGALAAHMRALRIREAMGDEVGTARSLSMIGKLYWQQGDLPAALASSRRAYAIAQRKDSLYLGEILNGLGMFMLEAGRPDTAIVLFKQAIASERIAHPNSGVAIERYELGLAYMDLDRIDSAQLMFRAGLEEARLGEDLAGEVNCYMGLGDALMRQGRYAAAGPPLDSGMVLALENGLPEAIMQLHSSLSEQREHQGDAVGALWHYRRFHALSDSLMDVAKNTSMNELRVQYDTEKKERENQRLRAAQELSDLRVQRGRWIAASAVFLAVAIGAVAWMLLQRGRERARRREDDLEQQAMRLQMDPHFLFNALNTIPGLYASGDIAHANDHVGHLSKFLRLVLETSRKRTIALSQELELVDDYLHICANRRPGSFTWSVRLSPAVHAERVAIPPMLVQPLVENALEHGLRGVEQGGHIAITVEQEGGDVVIQVRDNGIGRKAAALRKVHRLGASLGLGLVRDRLRIQGRSTPGTDPVTVRDENHPDGTPAGTTVVLRMQTTDLRDHAARSDH